MTDHGFGLANLPYGVDDAGHVVVAYGEGVVDLATLDGLDVDRAVFASGSLNEFFRLGPDAWARTRAQLKKLVPDAPVRPARLVLPWEVGGYADF
jgi:fumarylacetoacetase